MAQYVCPSASKTRLMNALGLISGEQGDEDLYNAIKAECIVEYDHLCADRRNLLVQFAHIPDRFTYNQMQPAAIDSAIVRIYHNAQPIVRQWYDHWGVDGTKGNFIIRWFLYKLFRYRDARNDPRTRNLDLHEDDDFEKDDNEEQSESSSSRSSGISTFYDAARNGFRTA